MGRKLARIDLKAAGRLRLAHSALNGPQNGSNDALETVSEEERSFALMAAANPLILELQERLQLVGEQTGRPYRLFTDEQLQTFQPQPPVKPTDQLRQIALRAFQGERTYSRQEAIEILARELSIGEERAEKGLQMLLDSGLLDPIAEGGTLHVGGSTPF